MDFWNSVAGIVQVELTSAEPEETFAAINRDDIVIKNLEKVSELTYSFSVSRSAYRTLKSICKKRGNILRIVRHNGLYWIMRRFFQRYVLLIGGSVLLFLVLWLPSRVLFVCVEGNAQVPTRRILDAAEACGIFPGASRREVRSEKIKNALLYSVPELQWAGINTSGCTATITVREKSLPEESVENHAIASIVSSRDGYILSCTVTRGNALVRPGQSVRQGQVLISAYTDCGLCIRAERAEGEVIGQTTRTIHALYPGVYRNRSDVIDIKYKLSLLFRKKRINLWKDSGIWEGSCGRMYKENYITLPGGFQLPIGLCLEEYRFYKTVESSITEETAAVALKAFAEQYLLQHMVAGSIINKNQSVVQDNGAYRLKGEYACIEMIGKIRQEQIGDTNGKNN